MMNSVSIIEDAKILFDSEVLSRHLDQMSGGLFSWSKAGDRMIGYLIKAVFSSLILLKLYYNIFDGNEEYKDA